MVVPVALMLISGIMLALVNTTKPSTRHIQSVKLGIIAGGGKYTHGGRYRQNGVPEMVMRIFARCTARTGLNVISQEYTSEVC